MTEIEKTAALINIEMKLSRIVSKQKHRCNVEKESFEDYFRIAVYVPYLDSIISSLTERFSEENNIAFSLIKLHPKLFMKLNEEERIRTCQVC